MKRYQIIQYDEASHELSAVRYAYKSIAMARESLVDIVADFKGYISVEHWKEIDADEAKHAIKNICLYNEWEDSVDSGNLLWRVHWKIIEVNFE